MKRLRDQLKKLQSRRKSKPKKKKAPRVVNIKLLNKKIKEEKDVRLFLEQAIEIEDEEELLAGIRRFTTAAKNSYLKNFFFGDSGMVTMLPAEEYRKFIRGYLDQPTERTIRENKAGKIIETTIQIAPKGLRDFWELYIEQPNVQKIIEVQAEKRAEEERLLKALKGLKANEVVVEPSLGDPLPPPPVRRRTKPRTTIMVEYMRDKDGKIVLGEDGKPVLRELGVPSKLRKSKSNLGENKCIREQMTAPWVNGVVKGCYILPIRKKHTKGLLDKYFYPDQAVEVKLSTGPYAEKTMKLYRAKRSFYTLLCGRQSSRNEQRREVLVAHTSTGEVISFYMAYKIKNGLIKIQNEEMAAKKDEWYARAKEGRADRMRRLLNGPVTSKLVNICVIRLSASLDKIGGSLGHQQDFAIAACEAIDKNSDASKYIDRIANTLAYLDDPSATIFRQRVREGWYNPRVFVSLTPQQMFPHSDVGGSSEIAQSNAKVILARKDRIKQAISKLYYQTNYPLESIPTRPTPLNPQKIKVQIDEWRKKCENKEKIGDVPDYRIVTYNEDGKTYCLDMEELLLQIPSGSEKDLEKLIKSGTIVNPNTGTPLREEFVRVLMQNFDNIIWRRDKDEDEDDTGEDDTGEDDTADDIPPPEKMLASGLMDLVLSNIASCQEELAQEQVEAGEKCPAMDRTEIHEDEEDDTDDEDEEDDTDDEDEEDDTDDEDEEDDTDDEDEEDDTDDEDDIPPPPPPQLSPRKATNCETCGKRLEPKSAYKTIRLSDGTYMQEMYCPGEKCMGAAKFRGGRKKGGRKGTKDRKK